MAAEEEVLIVGVNNPPTPMDEIGEEELNNLNDALATFDIAENGEDVVVVPPTDPVAEETANFQARTLAIREALLLTANANVRDIVVNAMTEQLTLPDVCPDLTNADQLAGAFMQAEPTLVGMEDVVLARAQAIANEIAANLPRWQYAALVPVSTRLTGQFVQQHSQMQFYSQRMFQEVAMLINIMGTTIAPELHAVGVDVGESKSFLLSMFLTNTAFFTNLDNLVKTCKTLKSLRDAYAKGRITYFAVRIRRRQLREAREAEAAARDNARF